MSSDQRLWIQKFLAPGDDLQEWYALDVEGQVTGAFVMDARLRLLDLHPHHAVVKVTDDLGAEEVRVYELRPAPSDG